MCVQGAKSCDAKFGFDCLPRKRPHPACASIDARSHPVSASSPLCRTIRTATVIKASKYAQHNVLS